MAPAASQILPCPPGGGWGMYAVIFISFSYQSLDANQVMGTLLCLPGGLAVRPAPPCGQGAALPRDRGAAVPAAMQRRTGHSALPAGPARSHHTVPCSAGGSCAYSAAVPNSWGYRRGPAPPHVGVDSTAAARLPAKCPVPELVTGIVCPAVMRCLPRNPPLPRARVPWQPWLAEGLDWFGCFK